MELGKQIKKYRNYMGLSQDALAEKIFVTRQSISNWENDKTYPDINSLIRLSETFDISVDALIKGDAEVIQKIINEDDQKQFTKMSWIYTGLFFLMLITPIPLVKFLGFWGMGIWGILAAVTLIYAFTVEKKKKELNISTYREISAFLEGKQLDEIEAAREEGKRGYQRFFLAIVAGVVALVVSVVMIFIFA